MKAIQPAIESCSLVLHAAHGKENRLVAIFVIIFITVILNLIFDAYEVQDTVRDDLQTSPSFPLIPTL